MKTLFLIVCTFSLAAQNDLSRLYLFDDFVSTPTSLAGPFQTNTSGGSVSSIDIPEPFYQGILSLSTLTGSTNRAAIGTYSTALTAGGGEWRMRVAIDSINVLCDNTDRYALMIGFFDGYSVNRIDGVYFLYDSIGVTSGSASSDRWQCVTVSNGSASFYETSVDVGTQDAILEITINSDGTSAEFFINGESVRTQTATIPSGRGRTFGAGANIVKSAGTNARFVYIDYILLEHIYAIQRQ